MFFFFLKQKTAYEMRISDWSSDVCSSDLQRIIKQIGKRDKTVAQTIEEEMFIFDNLIEMDDKNLGALLRTIENDVLVVALKGCNELLKSKIFGCMSSRAAQAIQDEIEDRGRSEEHTSELQSLMRISYAVFCL